VVPQTYFYSTVPNQNLFLRSIILSYQMNFCLMHWLLFNETFPTPHTGFQKYHTSSYTTFSHIHLVCKIKMTFAYMHTCLCLPLEIDYWLLECLVWIDCEEEQDNLCDCCECASCYQGKWHTYPLPIFTTALVCFSSMHDRWNDQLFYQMLRS
jgi:hypothetical protein